MSVAALEAKLKQTAPSDLPQLVIPVDFAGLPCALKEMRALADRYGFKILEDASHATGASSQGQPVGSVWADATVFSFHAVKILTTGEGGLVTTQNAELAQKFRLLRSHGLTRDAAMMEHPSQDPWYYEQLDLGFNYRMTDLQAALGLSQLHRLDAMHQRREALASAYDSLLRGLPVLLPTRVAGSVSSWHLYVIEIDETRCAASRQAVFRAMRAADIGVNVHYIPIHTQPYYKRLGFKTADFPAAERYYARAISLPLFPAMTADQQNYVVQTLAQALGSKT